jgi:hypothetical protein
MLERINVNEIFIKELNAVIERFRNILAQELGGREIVVGGRSERRINEIIDMRKINRTADVYCNIEVSHLFYYSKL